MRYFISETALDGSVYSCDKISIVGKISYLFLDNFSSDLSMFFIKWDCNSDVNGSDYPWIPKTMLKSIYYERFGVKYYRNNFDIILTDKSSFYFAYKHNSQIGKENDVSFKIELNPNKCLPCDFVDEFIKFIISRAKPSSVRISQLDIAIDFRTDRNNVYLEKDRRMHTRIDSGSDNITEYLSKHNEHGFVKLYNKTAESKLDYILTRLEITLKEFTYKDFTDVFPNVHIYNDKQITFDDELLKLSQNDEVFISLLRIHPEYFKKLTFRKQQKYRMFIDDSAPVLEPDINAYVNLINRIRDYFYVSK